MARRKPWRLRLRFDPGKRWQTIAYENKAAALKGRAMYLDAGWECEELTDVRLLDNEGNER